MLTPDLDRSMPLGVECAWPVPARAGVGLPSGVRMRIDLRRGTLLRVREGAGKTVTALAGSVWITEQDSALDVVLHAGQSCRLACQGLALAEALSDASISFDPTRATGVLPL